jgi:hypothetical protein
MSFVRLTGPVGAPGADAVGLAQIWGHDGDAWADGFVLADHDRVVADGSVITASDGDWVIDTTPMLYQIRGGALVRVTALAAGPSGPAGPVGGTEPHVHEFDIAWTYARLTARTSAVSLTTVREVKV